MNVQDLACGNNNNNYMMPGKELFLGHSILLGLSTFLFKSLLFSPLGYPVCKGVTC